MDERRLPPRRRAFGCSVSAAQGPGVPPGLRERVLSGVEFERATPAWQQPLRVVLAVTGLGAVLRWVVLGIGIGPADFEWASGALAGALPFGVALAMTVAIGTGRRGMLGPPAERIVAVVVFGSAVLVVWALTRDVSSNSVVAGLAPRPEPHPDVAAAVGAAVAALAIGWRDDPSHPVLGGAALGACAGALLAAATCASCPVGVPSHVIIHHLSFVPALFVFCALAVRFGRRYLCP